MSLEKFGSSVSQLWQVNATVKGKRGFKRRELEVAHIYHRDIKQSVKKKAR